MSRDNSIPISRIKAGSEQLKETTILLYGKLPLLIKNGLVASSKIAFSLNHFKNGSFTKGIITTPISSFNLNSCK